MNLFKGCDVMYYENFKSDRAEEYDYIILSGGPISITGDNIRKEKEWLKITNKPIFGICLGLQILCLVYDEELIYNKFPNNYNKKLYENVKFIDSDYNMFYNHSYFFNKIPKDFIGEIKNDILIYMKHKTKPVLAFQGHPEMSENGERLAEFFLKEIIK